MARKETLPAGVSSFLDRHGKRRYRFRRRGDKPRYFKSAPGTPEFKTELEDFRTAAPGQSDSQGKLAKGSVAALAEVYFRSTDYRGNAVEVTLKKRRAVLDAFIALNGHRLIRDARYDKLDGYVAKVAAGEIGKGGQFAAETARKVLTRFFAYAVKVGWRSDNPMVHVTFRPRKTPGFHSWTETEIEQYRAHWPLGTKQRLALELMLWTGKRRSDAVALGPQHIDGGRCAVATRKPARHGCCRLRRNCARRSTRCLLAIISASFQAIGAGHTAPPRSEICSVSGAMTPACRTAPPTGSGRRSAGALRIWKSAMPGSSRSRCTAAMTRWRSILLRLTRSDSLDRASVRFQSGSWLTHWLTKMTGRHQMAELRALLNVVAPRVGVPESRISETIDWLTVRFSAAQSRAFSVFLANHFLRSPSGGGLCSRAAEK